MSSLMFVLRHLLTGRSVRGTHMVEHIWWIKKYIQKYYSEKLKGVGKK